MASLDNFRVAGITMVFNEAINLPLWEQYYGAQLGHQHTYIIDHGTNDGSTDHVQGNKITIPRTKFDDPQRARFISNFHRSLLEYYDVVFYSDCDEFLVPDPAKHLNLVDYISNMTESCATPIGLNMVHIVDDEEPLDVTKSIFDQRHYVVFSSPMCKTLISKVPINWGGGFHSCDCLSGIDSDLYLFHIARVDLTNSLKRLQVTRSIEWKSERPGSPHQRISDSLLISQFNQIGRLERVEDEDFKFVEEVEKYNKSYGRMDNGLYNALPPFRGSRLYRIPDRFKGRL